DCHTCAHLGRLLRLVIFPEETPTVDDPEQKDQQQRKHNCEFGRACTNRRSDKVLVSSGHRPCTAAFDSAVRQRFVALKPSFDRTDWYLTRAETVTTGISP